MDLATKQMSGLQEGVTNRDKDVFITQVSGTESKAMAVDDRQLRIITANITQHFAVTLPSVKEARGLIYEITLVTKATYNVTVDDLNDDAALSQITLDTTADYVVLFSNGFEWRQLAGETA